MYFVRGKDLLQCGRTGTHRRTMDVTEVDYDGQLFSTVYQVRGKIYSRGGFSERVRELLKGKEDVRVTRCRSG